MAKSDALSSLKKACSAPFPQPSQIIAVGPTAWFQGAPAPAPEGTVALATGGGILTLVNEENILQVQREGELFKVQVREGTHILCRLDIVTAARRSSHGDCCDSSGKTISRENVIDLSGNGELSTMAVIDNKVCAVTCTIDYIVTPEFWIPVIHCSKQCLN